MAVLSGRTNDEIALERVLTLVNATRSGRDESARRAARLEAVGVFGDDAAMRELEDLVDDAFGSPATRLAVYGTLAPGKSNHHVIEPVGGSWRAVELVGKLGAWEGYPMFEWQPAGDVVAAWLLESDALPSFWARLDEFETRAYDRHLVPCRADGEVIVANCYVRAQTPGNT